MGDCSSPGRGCRQHMGLGTTRMVAPGCDRLRAVDACAGAVTRPWGCLVAGMGLRHHLPVGGPPLDVHGHDHQGGPGTRASSTAVQRAVPVPWVKHRHSHHGLESASSPRQVARGISWSGVAVHFTRTLDHTGRVGAIRLLRRVLITVDRVRVHRHMDAWLHAHWRCMGYQLRCVVGHGTCLSDSSACVSHPATLGSVCCSLYRGAWGRLDVDHMGPNLGLAIELSPLATECGAGSQIRPRPCLSST